MRVKLLTSFVPLILAAAVAGGELAPSARPCISYGGMTLQIATVPWQHQFHVSFTDDRAKATVRVQIVDRPELADFTVMDDVDTADADSCSGETTFVSAAPHLPGEPVIYLSAEDGADYRIFVRSHTFSAQDAAALIVGAGRRSTSQTTAL